MQLTVVCLHVEKKDAKGDDKKKKEEDKKKKVEKPESPAAGKVIWRMAE